ncbi:hypothetical protein F5X99DRAFT_385359 [Biscogniauxia marginata]|nr:hypothetical protein F5X99DRAFT_385359 [Biscogniauxia marginata]
MQSVLVSLVSLLAAAAIAAPVSGVPGVGSVSSPLTTVLEQAGQQTPQALNKATETVKNDQQTTKGAGKPTTSSKPNTSSKAASADPVTGLLSGLTGGLGVL